MRRHLVVTLSLFAAPALAQGRCEVGPTATQTERSSQHEWRAYASDNASSKFSLADQIDRENFESLETAWRWCSPDSDVVAANPGLWPHHYEVTPLLVDGVVYTSTPLSQAAAIDPVTGRRVGSSIPRATALARRQTWDTSIAASPIERTTRIGGSFTAPGTLFFTL